MLHPKTLETYIARLHEMIAKIEQYTKDIRNYEEFAADEKTVDAVIPPITQIGEITSKIQKLYPDSLELPYKDIVGMRNVLVHMYHKVETKTLRKTITVSIPALKKLLDSHK